MLQAGVVTVLQEVRLARLQADQLEHERGKARADCAAADARCAALAQDIDEEVERAEAGARARLAAREQELQAEWGAQLRDAQVKCLFFDARWGYLKL